MSQHQELAEKGTDPRFSQLPMVSDAHFPPQQPPLWAFSEHRWLTISWNSTEPSGEGVFSSRVDTDVAMEGKRQEGLS